MKTSKFIGIIFLLTLAFSALAVLAQSPVQTEPIPKTQGEWETLKRCLFGEFGWFVAVSSWIGVLRVVVKTISGKFCEFISTQASKTDVERLAKIQDALWYKITVFVMDWLLSVKLPKTFEKGGV